MGSHPGDVQPPCAVLEEYQRVQPAQVDQVDVREVAGDDALGLRGQELAPRRALAARGRIDARRRQDFPDRRRADRMPEADEFALDPPAVPSADSPGPAAAPAPSGRSRSAACWARSGACRSPTSGRSAGGAMRAESRASPETPAPTGAGGSVEDSAANHSRSVGSYRTGAVSCLRSTAFPCRSTSSSASLAASRHRITAGTASSFRATLYTNETITWTGFQQLSVARHTRSEQQRSVSERHTIAMNTPDENDTSPDDEQTRERSAQQAQRKAPQRKARLHAEAQQAAAHEENSKLLQGQEFFALARSHGAPTLPALCADRDPDGTTYRRTTVAAAGPGLSDTSFHDPRWAVRSEATLYVWPRGIRLRRSSTTGPSLPTAVPTRPTSSATSRPTSWQRRLRCWTWFPRPRDRGRCSGQGWCPWRSTGRSSPFVFSLVPRCQDECGSQK